MQQSPSAQHYLPGAATALRSEPYMQDNQGGSMSCQPFLTVARVHIQSTKDLSGTLLSASQNTSVTDCLKSGKECLNYLKKKDLYIFYA